MPSGRAGLDGPVGISYEAGDRLYVASSHDDSVLYFDGITGAFVDEVVVSGLGGLDEPQYFIIGPDANGDGDVELYVTSFANDSVMRYNAVTGAFVDDFVYSGNGGLDGPTGVHFLADGSLIVSSSNTDEVMRFNTAGTPTFDFYKFTIENDNDRGIFDIDFGFDQLAIPAALTPRSSSSMTPVRSLRPMTTPASGLATAAASSHRTRIWKSFSPRPASTTWSSANSTPMSAGGVGMGNRADLTDTYTLQISIENYNGRSFEGMAVSMLPDVDSGRRLRGRRSAG